MAARGRKPKPTAQKELTGNPGKRSLPKNEPKPVKELTVCPDFIPEEARTHWPYVKKLLGEVPGVSKKPDEVVAGLMCQAIHDFVTADEDLRANGGNYQDVMTKSGDVMTRIHPAVSVKKAAFDQIMKICSEFGLTPSSRTRLKADLGEDKKNPNDKYFTPEN